MSVNEIRTELIRLAAELVTGKDTPSYFSEDHSPRRSRAYWLKQLELAEEIGRNRGIRLKAVADKLLALSAHEPSARIATLFAAVEHGDQEHRVWLKQAIEDHFASRPVEHPRGKGAPVPPGDGLPHYTCPNCEARHEFSVRHDTVEDRRPDVTGYLVVPVVKCEACGQEVRAELRGDESRIGLRPAEPPSDTRGSEPSAADMANAGAAKELAGFRYAFAARDRLIEMEQEALHNRNKSQK